MNIRSEEISVVVQGPIFLGPSTHANEPLTQRTLKSVRTFLPKSELILSTWKGSPTDGLTYDILVENEDPGQIAGTKHSANLNRQIVSTLSGIKRASRPFCLKIRTDTPLVSTGFIGFFKKFEKRLSSHRLFEERLVTIDLFSRRPENTAFLYHVSDISQFGALEDLRRLWDIPLMRQDDPFYDRFVPENYIFLNALWKNGLISSPYDALRFSLKSLRQADLFLVNNYVIADAQDYGIWLSPRLMSLVIPSATYAHRDWIALYRYYCVQGHLSAPFVKQFRYLTAHLAWMDNPIRAFIRKSLRKTRISQTPAYLKLRVRAQNALMNLYHRISQKEKLS